MVHYIPEGTHTVTPHLVVKGAAKAIDFYKAAFGATELYRMPGPGGGIAHAEIQIADSRVYLADEFPEGAVRSPRGHGLDACGQARQDVAPQESGEAEGQAEDEERGPQASLTSGLRSPLAPGAASD